MYLHIGENVSLNSMDIVGIFDIDKTTTTSGTRGFLSHSEQKETSITISDDMPKSFIVVSNMENRNKIYISPISVATLKQRAKKGTFN